ncbi:glycoside hydrolase family 13 protein [Bipolaris maydis ATCC 48331]|uniref:Glycoside hydrolase family 13 protein n=2 Tax=Cochliobolus heterostrophus TaxID=5016 RepID=M2SIB1_COCH5|nr:glycoside hydrolase family 13 protein [Bipolaris maydis ATCC 48331]EMD85110.1 glycoside hydrolase family 13 protein [Bipolaris maydis C5]KAH7559937.1 glycoside hydrolase family 13 protein [Bipolaris maydis]ENH99226.1 glycoside hydrolase family 13 protein [Bipolaris maydis ATCC 48331]KAJ5064789.1 alpha-glucosidase [Bipolaris maydis]KAJ6193200.1 alpha-glucosidase [Bipolaris maydis]
MTITPRPWWKDAVVYQIYPASFKDSNGDGIGDLNGIISELDYIRSIGVDVIWVCPMYDSPQVDMGYDIRNYEDVYRPYGTVQDMQRLIDETHSRGMKIILDLVVNHTSDQHQWFQESRSSKDNPKRDWYIWRPARYVDGVRKPPNNWVSNFTGSVWEWDEHTQEYYLHLFCPEQPDLNWENPETRKAIYESAMEFWLKRGVDGFRVDTVNMYSKGDMRDAPITDPGSEWQFAGYQYCNGPRMDEFLGEMNQILEKYDAMTVGECPHTLDINRVHQYVSAKEKRLSMVFQFDVVDVGQGPYKFQTTPKNWTLPQLKRAIARTQDLIRPPSDSWTTAFLENHDQARSITRFTSDAPQHRVAGGKMLALMLSALSGTLFIYQGQEIGMTNFPESWDMSEYKDVESSNYYKMVAKRTNNDVDALAAAHKSLQHLARDHSRVPMSWSTAPYNGFSPPDAKDKPWMRPLEDADICNAKAQQNDKTSVLGFWKHMLQLRKEHKDLLVFGQYDDLDVDNEQFYIFSKTWQGKRALCICNFTDESKQLVLPESVAAQKMQLLVSSRQDEGVEEKTLAPYEGRVYLYVQ